MRSRLRLLTCHNHSLVGSWTLWASLIVAVSPVAAHAQAHDMGAMASTTALPHNIPDFCAIPTIVSVASGAWSSPSTWSPARVPAANDVVNIATGTTVTYDIVSDLAMKCVAVNGGLSFRNDVNTRLKVGTFMVMTTGKLDVGTPGAPVAANVTAEIIIANQPLNTTADPEQYGTGLIGLGRVRMHGAIKTPTFSRVAVEPVKGSTTLTLEQAVTGWRVGDRVIIPDTRHLKWNEVNNWRIIAPQWEERTVAGISTDGKVMTLNAGLTFDHLGARDRSGALRFLPHLGNLSRNVIVRSEVPIGGAGVQGHAIFTDRADVDIRYAAFRDLGRTVAADTGPGNQIGRYPMHLHHLMGPAATPGNGYQYTLVGNAIDGGSTDHRRRWALAIHNTHYGLVQDNVLYNYGGALVSTEDGSESFNVIDHNFAVRSRGTGGRLGDGNEGQGFWFRGPNNYIRNNVAANFDDDDAEGSYGYKYFMRLLGNVSMPTAKGQDMSAYVTRDGNALPILEFSNNEVYGASQGGLTYWWVSSQDPIAAASPLESVFKDLKIWHVYNVGIYHYPSARITFDGLTILGEDPELSACCGRGFHGEDYAATDVRIVNADIEGMNLGLRWSSAGTGLQIVERSTLRNETDMVVKTMYSANGPGWLPARTVIANNVKFQGTTTIAMDWDVNSQSNTTQRDSVLVYDYNGVASDDFQVYYNEQATQNLAGGVSPCANHRSEIDGVVCASPASSGPIITWVSPFQGSTAGGTVTKVSGANFASGATVTFGGTAAASIVPGSASGLTATTPPRAAGNADVKVTNPNGQSFTFKNGFRFEVGASCSYIVSPTSQAMAAGGGGTSASVTTGSSCNWSATSQASWISITAGAAGTGDGTVSYSVGANTGTAERSGTLTIAGRIVTVVQEGQQAVVTALTLAADKVAPQPAGTTVTWTATATAGIAPLQYKWWVFNGTAWSVARDWGALNTFAWRPTTANGSYIVVVWVRSNGNGADAGEKDAGAYFAIVQGTVTAVTLAADKVAPQPPGTTVTWTATAAGGIAPFQYKWWVFNGTAWSVARDWGTANTFAWRPTTANGGYIVVVWVRSNGNVADAAEKDAGTSFAILQGTVTAVTLAADRVAPQPAGTTVTWTATAAGGIAPLQYKWWVFDGNTWSVARDWGTANTFAWRPTTANGSYIVVVWVRSNGNGADAAEKDAGTAFAIVQGTFTTVARAAAEVVLQDWSGRDWSARADLRRPAM